MFISERTGEPLEHPRHWFEPAIQEAGIRDFHWHDLRHTFASRLRMQGLSLETIADLLGHKGLTMARRYAHLGPSQLLEAVALLNRKSSATVITTGDPAENGNAGQPFVN